MNHEDIVRLWHRTQEGHINECRKNQVIFSEIMWKLYNEQQDT